MAGFDAWLTVTDPALLAEHLAAEFRLSRNEMEKVSEALAPAFALGLRRALADPAAAAGLSRAFRAMMPGSGYGAAAVPNAPPGQAFLDAFFGSEALAAAVARQASLVAGIAPDTIQKLMPGLAMLTMESMARAAMREAGRSRPAAGPGEAGRLGSLEGLAAATGDVGEAAAAMMRRGAEVPAALSRSSATPPPGRPAPPAAAFGPGAMADAFAEALGAGFGGLAGKAGRSAPPLPLPSVRPSASKEAAPGPFDPPAALPADALAPFTVLFEAVARGRHAQGDGALAPAPLAAEPGSAAAGDRPAGGRLHPDGRLGDDYAKEMAALFERHAGVGKAV